MIRLTVKEDARRTEALLRAVKALSETRVEVGLPDSAGARLRRVLAIHQAFAAEAVRAALPNAEVTCATWFRQPAATARPGDFTLVEETVRGSDRPRSP